MGAFIPLICLMVLTILMWQHRRNAPPIVWNWRLRLAVAIGVLGAAAMPFVVAAALTR